MPRDKKQLRLRSGRKDLYKTKASIINFIILLQKFTFHQFSLKPAMGAKAKLWMILSWESWPGNANLLKRNFWN